MIAISVLALTAIIAVLVLYTGPFSRSGEAIANVTVYKSPTCGCCSKWVDHLEDNGFNVIVKNQYDVSPMKRQLAVPEPLRACHTATVGDYVIEGHVPATDIIRLLNDKPSIRGLAVAGMPQGSPGMETGRLDRYSVMSFNEQGVTRTYNTY
ncbi:MAG: CopG family transcriptional regulator [marine bacterium B5-7]|nr:MAG: CopG family transcriptional regulator [marine bacterium B5-7]